MSWGASALRILAALLVAYAVAGVLAWLFADRLIFRPPAPHHARAGELLIPTGDGDSIAARWLPNAAARHVILYSHGNAEDLGTLEPVLGALHAAGFAVLAYDYRGYGHSTRRPPSERRAYQDHAAAYRHLTRALGVSPSRIIIHGRSLGGGIASELAGRCPAAGLVLESTFTSAFRVAAPPLFPFDRFATLPRMKTLRVPVLIIHGTDDAVIPIDHGRVLHDAAPAGTHAVWVEGAGHDDLVIVAGDRYFAALRDFASSLPPTAEDRVC